MSKAGGGMMERLTMTSPQGGVAFTFDLDVTCEKSEMLKILKLAERLKQYEDTNLTPEQMIQIDKDYSELAKELAELKKQLPPCKVGNTVYWVNNHYRTYGDYKIDEEKVERLIFDGEDWIVNMGGPKEGIFGETVFLSREEAEAKLKEMEGK
ncbi:MAG: hypothetical protein ACLRZ9_06080 [Eubacterium sp.]